MCPSDSVSGGTFGPDIEFDAIGTLFRIAGEAPCMEDFIGGLPDHFKKYSGCEHIGIRMQSGDDYPYVAHTGLSQKFLDDEDGTFLSQTGDGYPHGLSCLCGDIIDGRFDSTQPYYTERGSFWTNNLSRLLAETSDNELKTDTRCLHKDEWFESVAFIPITGTDDNVGVIQLLEKRPGFFGPDLIAFLERQAHYISEIVRLLYYPDSVSYRQLLTDLFDAIPGVAFALNTGGRIVLTNESARSLMLDGETFPGKFTVSDIKPVRASRQIDNMLGFVINSLTQVRFVLNTNAGPVDCAMVPVLNPKGHPTVLAVFGQVLSDRAREIENADRNGKNHNLDLLEGYIPICSSCRKIRDNEGDWHELENYIRFKTVAEFSHCICPDCADRLYPGLFDRD